MKELIQTGWYDLVASFRFNGHLRCYAQFNLITMGIKYKYNNKKGNHRETVAGGILLTSPFGITLDMPVSDSKQKYKNILNPCLDFSKSMVKARKKSNHNVVKNDYTKDDEMIRLVGMELAIKRIKKLIKNKQNEKRR